MPRTKISEFSATAASNTDIDSINIAEGCAPSGINDAIRELMSQLKDFQTGAVGDSFNGPVGSTTASTGAFTTLSASSTLGVTGVSTLTGGAVVQGLTVGRGAGAVSTNSAFGTSAMASITSGGSNTGIGRLALYGTTTGASNTALGNSSAQSNTTGSNNVAVGDNALFSNTTSSNNTAVGYQAAYSNTTAVSLVAVGKTALYSNTTGQYNTAIGSPDGSGQSTMGTNTTGQYNTAVGGGALSFNSTASESTAVGFQAGYLANANYSTFVGMYAGYNTTSGVSNTFVGYGSGHNTTGGTGGYNTCIGDTSGSALTSGAKNTILGRYTGNQGGLDIRTSSNYIVLSDGDGNYRVTHDGNATGKLFPRIQTNSRFYGWDDTQFYPSPDNTLSLGLASFRWTTVYATTASINTSDANLKQDIANLDDAEKRIAVAIKSLIKKYRFKDAVAQKGDAARIHIGAVAQEVQAAFVAEGLDPARYALFCSDTWYEVDGKAGEPANPYTADTPNAVKITQLGLRYEELLAFVIAAL